MGELTRRRKLKIKPMQIRVKYLYKAFLFVFYPKIKKQENIVHL